MKKIFFITPQSRALETRTPQQNCEELNLERLNKRNYLLNDKKKCSYGRGVKKQKSATNFIAADL
jgi:hypothetical protein